MEYKGTEETGEADWRERGRMAWGGAVEQMKATGEMGEEGGDIEDIKDGCDDETYVTSVTVVITDGRKITMTVPAVGRSGRVGKKVATGAATPAGELALTSAVDWRRVRRRKERKR